MELTLSFKLEKETKGAVRYTQTDGEQVGTIYLRKAALEQPYPEKLTVVIQSVMPGPGPG